MARPVTPIQLSTEQSEILNNISRSRELPHSTVQRAQIVLAAASGQGNKAIGEELNLYPETVALWRNRWLTEQQELEKVAGKPNPLLNAICSVLACLQLHLCGSDLEPESAGLVRQSCTGF